MHKCSLFLVMENWLKFVEKSCKTLTGKFYEPLLGKAQGFKVLKSNNYRKIYVIPKMADFLLSLSLKSKRLRF